jgi:hypothetical protein
MGMGETAGTGKTFAKRLPGMREKEQKNPVRLQTDIFVFREKTAVKSYLHYR